MRKKKKLLEKKFAIKEEGKLPLYFFDIGMDNIVPSIPNITIRKKHTSFTFISKGFHKPISKIFNEIQ